MMAKDRIMLYLLYVHNFFGYKNRKGRWYNQSCWGDKMMFDLVWISLRIASIIQFKRNRHLFGKHLNGKNQQSHKSHQEKMAKYWLKRCAVRSTGKYAKIHHIILLDLLKRLFLYDNSNDLFASPNQRVYPDLFGKVKEALWLMEKVNLYQMNQFEPCLYIYIELKSAKDNSRLQYCLPDFWYAALLTKENTHAKFSVQP